MPSAALTDPSGKLTSFPEYIAPMSPVQFNRINNHFPPLDPRKHYRGVYERCGFDVYKGDGKKKSKAKSNNDGTAVGNYDGSFLKSNQSSSTTNLKDEIIGMQPPNMRSIGKKASLPNMQQPSFPGLTKKNSSSSLSSYTNQQQTTKNNNIMNGNAYNLPPATPMSPSSVGSTSSRSSIRSAFFRPFKKGSKSKNIGGNSNGIESAASSDYSSSAHTSLSIATNQADPLFNQKPSIHANGSSSSSPLKSTFSPSARIPQREFEKPSALSNSGMSTTPSSPSSIKSFPKNPFAPSSANNTNAPARGLGIRGNNNSSSPQLSTTGAYQKSDNSTDNLFSPVSADSTNNIFSPTGKSFSDVSSTATTPGNLASDKFANFSENNPLAFDNKESQQSQQQRQPENKEKVNSVQYNGFFARKFGTPMSPNSFTRSTSEESVDGKVTSTVKDSRTNASISDNNNTASENSQFQKKDSEKGFSGLSSSSNSSSESLMKRNENSSSDSIRTNDEFLDTIKSFNSFEENDDDVDVYNSSVIRAVNGTGNTKQAKSETREAKKVTTGDDDDNEKGFLNNDNDEEAMSSKSLAEKNKDKLMRKLTTKLDRMSGQFGLNLTNEDSSSAATVKNRKHSSVASSIYSVDDLEHSDDNEEEAEREREAARLLKENTLANSRIGHTPQQAKSDSDFELEDGDDELTKDIVGSADNGGSALDSPHSANASDDDDDDDDDLLGDIKELKSNTNSLYIDNKSPLTDSGIFNTSNAPSLPTITVSDANMHNSSQLSSTSGDDESNESTSSMAKSLFRDLQKKTAIGSVNTNSNAVNINSSSNGIAQNIENVDADASCASAKTLYNDIEGILKHTDSNSHAKMSTPADISMNSSSTTLPMASSSSVSLHTAHTSFTQPGHEDYSTTSLSNPVTTSTSMSSLSEDHFNFNLSNKANNNDNGNNNDHDNGRFSKSETATLANTSISRSNTLDSIDSEGSDDSILRKIVNMDESKDNILNATAAVAANSTDMENEKPLNIAAHKKQQQINFYNAKIPIANRIKAGTVELKDISDLSRNNSPNLNAQSNGFHNSHQANADAVGTANAAGDAAATAVAAALNHRDGNDAISQDSPVGAGIGLGQQANISSKQDQFYKLGMNSSNKSIPTSQNSNATTIQPTSANTIANGHGLQTPKLGEQFPPDYELPSPTSFKSQVSEELTDPMIDDEPKYPSGEGPCRKCHTEIQGKSIWSKDHQMSGRWHRECFRCYRCDQVFAKGTNCYVINDRPYCNYDFHFLNNSLCRICDQGIEGKCLENNNGERFHPDCLTCIKCGVFIVKDYFVLDGKPLCEKDGLYEIELERKQMEGQAQFRNADGEELQITSKVEKRRTFIRDLPENQPL